ncbi:MAG: hypothetical protein ACO4CZ_09475, partial [Planctomycetota bacterium]
RPGRHGGGRPLGNEFFLHRFESVSVWKGDAPATFTIVERKRVADAPRPSIGPDRLLCLRADPGAARFPADRGPYFVRLGYAGDDPVITDDDARTASYRTLVDALLGSEAGASPGATAAALSDLAVRGTGPARIEAAESLRSRPVLRDALSPIRRESLLATAIAVTDTDPELTESLASLCAEAGQAGVIDALCVALRSVEDPRLARALGRIARQTAGEGATETLTPYLREARGPLRDRLLLALGTTGTESALALLLGLRTRDGASAGVDAALRAHGAPRAVEVLRDEKR